MAGPPGERRARVSRAPSPPPPVAVRVQQQREHDAVERESEQEPHPGTVPGDQLGGVRDEGLGGDREEAVPGAAAVAVEAPDQRVPGTREAGQQHGAQQRDRRPGHHGGQGHAGHGEGEQRGHHVPEAHHPAGRLDVHPFLDHGRTPPCRRRVRRDRRTVRPGEQAGRPPSTGCGRAGRPRAGGAPRVTRTVDGDRTVTSIGGAAVEEPSAQALRSGP
jgi:hypothetical protein